MGIRYERCVGFLSWLSEPCEFYEGGFRRFQTQGGALTRKIPCMGALFGGGSGASLPAQLAQLLLIITRVWLRPPRIVGVVVFGSIRPFS